MVASTHRKPYFHEINTTSADYPWFRAEGDPYEPRDEHLAASEEGNVTHDEESNDEIEETSKQSVGASDYLPHHYFDYIAGTSAGGLDLAPSLPVWVSLMVAPLDCLPSCSAGCE